MAEGVRVKEGRKEGREEEKETTARKKERKRREKGSSLFTGRSGNLYSPQSW